MRLAPAEPTPSKFACAPDRTFLFDNHSRSNYLRKFINHFLYATMAPKKSKRTADSINSRLALVMKSGKYVGAIPRRRATY